MKHDSATVRYVSPVRRPRLATARWLGSAAFVCASALSACSSDSPDGVNASTAGQASQTEAGTSAASAGSPSDAAAGRAMAGAFFGSIATGGNGPSAASGGGPDFVFAGSGGTVASGGTSGGAGGSAGGRATGGAGGGGVGLAGAGSTATGGGNGIGLPSHQGVWKVMPLGDSITASTCYPQLLAQTLKASGHTNFEFVGSNKSNQSCNGAPNVQMEGHGGYSVTYLPADATHPPCDKSTGCGTYAELKTWAAEKPDIVLMHFGTNDVWGGNPTARITAAYLSVIAEFRKQNPSVIFFVSKIIKLNPPGCGACMSNVAALAQAVNGTWAASNSTPTSPIYIVDDYGSGFDPDNSNDTADHVHPKPPGAAKMATATARDVSAAKYF